MVLFDDWINVASSRAVMVLDPSGSEVAVHGFQEVQRTAGVPGSDIVASAKFGPWMQSQPRLSPSGDLALVETGGRTLAIRMDTGVLSIN